MSGTPGSTSVSGGRGVFLTVMAVLFVVLAISNMTKLLQHMRDPSHLGLVIFGYRLQTSLANAVFGPLFGAFLLSGISEMLATEMTSVASLFFGMVIVAAVVLTPRGLVDLTRCIRAQGWRYLSRNIRSHRL